MMEFNRDTMAAAQVAFGLAAQMVQQEPDEAWVRACIADDLFEEAPFGMEDPAVAAGVKLLSGWCHSAEEDVPRSVGDIQRDWLRLFVGLGAPEAPVWESFYTEPDSVLFGRCTLAVRAEFRAWGLEYEHKGSEPDDSLGRMLAFCSYLMGIEGKALDEGDAATAERAKAALEGFIVSHMLPWASAWRFLVKEHAKTDYYRGVGELVFGLERTYAARFGIKFNSEDGTFSYAARS